MASRALVPRPTPTLRTLLRPRRHLSTAPEPAATHRMKSQAPGTAESFPASMMTRVRDRPLPTLASLNPRRRWLRTLPIFIAIVAVSALGIFNYQKVNSPVITATLYSLRVDPRVRAALGDEVYFGNRWAWVHGEINLVQGRIDVWFRVKGTRNAGTCRFRAIRMGGRNGLFKTLEWSLTPDGGDEVIQLLDGAGDPLSGATF